MKAMVAMFGLEFMVTSSLVGKAAEIIMHDHKNYKIMHYSLQAQSLTTAIREFHLANCKYKRAVILPHYYFHCVKIGIDTDTPATCWLSTW